jgi:subtilisin family serine protease
MAPFMRSAAVFAAVLSDVSGLRKGATKRQATGTLAGVKVHYSEESSALADQWMVSFGPKASDAALAAFCAQAGCIAVGHPDEGGFAYALVQGTEKQLETSVAAHAAGIEFIEQDAIAEDFEEESSTTAPWGLGAIGVPRSRSKGSGVNVYVLDSGVRVSHTDFGGRAIPLYDAANYRPAKVCTGSGDARCARDDRGHGTHVAGSVGGDSFGVAPASTIFAMQRGRSLSDGFGCIDWLTMNKKRPAVLQMSWGTGSPSSTGRIAVDTAVAAGFTVTVASGNSNEDACRWTFAGIPSAIAVASTDSTMSRSSFSNYGPCIDILAPGSAILSADYRGDTRTSVKSGTSMAAPHVAGAAALVLEGNPQMSPAQVLQQLQSSARKDVIADGRTDNNYFLTVG